MKCWIDIDILKQYRDGSVSEEEKLSGPIAKCQNAMRVSCSSI